LLTRKQSEKGKTPMACIAPNQEWTIDTHIDGHPESETAVLVFCLSINNGIITGEGSDLSIDPPIPLSLVTGTSQSIPELDQGFPDPPTQMALNFTWRESQAVLSGTTFRSGGQNKFLGRFATFKSPEVNGGSGAVVAGASGNDVGTGTGTQT
jgi:hypothetical protein